MDAWKYRNKEFKTKQERDAYAKGWMEAMAECQRLRKVGEIELQYPH